jgi:hypothetical protein
MAVIFTDGFDKYGIPSFPNSQINIDTILQGEWTTAYANNVALPLSSTGYAISQGNSTLSKTLPGNFTRLIGGVRFKSPLSGTAGQTSGQVNFSDSGLTQASICILSGTGWVSLVGYAGTNAVTIATTSTFSLHANSIHYLEWDITFGIAGAYFIYVDGILVLSGNGITNGGTAVSQVNQFGLIGGNGGWTVDDLYLFDNTGPKNNAVLLTNPRIETQHPVGDDQTQFSNGQVVLGNVFSTSNAGSQYINRNDLILNKLIPGANMTMNSLFSYIQSYPADSWTAVVYSDVAGTPTTLLASSVDTPGYVVPANDPFIIDLQTPLALTGGTTYWVGFMFNTNILVNTLGREYVPTIDQLDEGFYATSVTYGSGPPGTAPAMTISPSWQILAYCDSSAKNWVSENRNPPIIDNQSYIFSNTVGNEDLYNFPNLTTHPTAIYAVAVKTYAKLTDVRMKSNVTSSSGTNAGQIPATSYEWIGSFFEFDPDTSADWTESGLNNAVSGIKVAT